MEGQNYCSQLALFHLIDMCMYLICIYVTEVMGATENWGNLVIIKSGKRNCLKYIFLPGHRVTESDAVLFTLLTIIYLIFHQTPMPITM